MDVTLELRCWPTDGKQPVEDDVPLLLPTIKDWGDCTVKTEFSQMVDWEKNRGWYVILDPSIFEKKCPKGTTKL